MILIFVALKAECGPTRARLVDSGALPGSDLEGYQGRIAGSPIMIVVTGMGMRRSRISAARAMDSLSPVDLIITSGVAGGLRDELTVGEVVLSERLLICRDGDFQPEQAIDVRTQCLNQFAAALKACEVSHAVGPTMTTRRPIITAADKQRAHLQSGGAISVDMESAAIAVEAERRGLPFVCVRSILDTACQEVVGARLLDQNSRVRPLAAAKALITHPQMILGVAHLLKNLRRSTHSLASTLEAVLPHLQTTAP
jgi:adenosylhomocysteine nucleosidase